MKPLTRTLCAMLLAGAVGGVFFERNALSNARIENQRLRAESEETVRLVRENAEIDRLHAENQELEQLRHETRELHKLRNEIRQLREEKPEWDKLRAQNQKLRAGAEPASQPASRAPDPASLIAKEMLSDAGFGSPETTLRTYFWALREGNREKMRSCFSPGTPEEQMPGGPAPSMATFKGFRVVAKKVVSADEVKLGIQFSSEQDVAPVEFVQKLNLNGIPTQLSSEQDAAPVEFVLPFKRVDGEWKVNLAFSQ